MGESTLVRGGTVFDGRGGPGVAADVLVRDGVVAELVPPGAPTPAADRTIDAAGCWVTPGFVDLHTHYDAEVEVAPGLDESVRHGITTALVGRRLRPAGLAAAVVLAQAALHVVFAFTSSAGILAPSQNRAFPEYGALPAYGALHEHGQILLGSPGGVAQIVIPSAAMLLAHAVAAVASFALLFSGNLVGNELIPEASAGIPLDFDLITSSWWTDA